MGGVGGSAGASGVGGGAGAARASVNLALGLHGLTESFSLSFVLDEEACNKEVGLQRCFIWFLLPPALKSRIASDIPRTPCA